jgi:hypothetical protein
MKMKTSILDQKCVTQETVALISRLVSLIPWPDRRRAMGDVTMTLLDGKPRVSEEVFGWSRSSVSLGINEYKSGVVCINDLSGRRKPKLEEKQPALLSDIHQILEPGSQTEPRLRTTLLYTNMTAQSVYDALVAGGWSKESLPTIPDGRVCRYDRLGNTVGVLPTLSQQVQ